MRPVAENCLSLDTNTLAKAEVFQPGVSATMEWGDGSAATLAYREPHIHLSYAIRGSPMHQVIPVEAASCHFGGNRYYFSCPGCDKRRYKLRLGGNGFYCRQCYGLPYYSQQCGYMDGLIHQKYKLKAKLDRPGIRIQTRMRLIDKLCDKEEQIDRALIERFGALAMNEYGIFV